jgi:hypothetical protein
VLVSALVFMNDDVLSAKIAAAALISLITARWATPSPKSISGASSGAPSESTVLPGAPGVLIGLGVTCGDAEPRGSATPKVEAGVTGEPDGAGEPDGVRKPRARRTGGTDIGSGGCKRESTVVIWAIRPPRPDERGLTITRFVFRYSKDSLVEW